MKSRKKEGEKIKKKRLKKENQAASQPKRNKAEIEHKQTNKQQKK